MSHSLGVVLALGGALAGAAPDESSLPTRANRTPLGYLLHDDVYGALGLIRPETPLQQKFHEETDEFREQAKTFREQKRRALDSVFYYEVDARCGEYLLEQQGFLFHPTDLAVTHYRIDSWPLPRVGEAVVVRVSEDDAVALENTVTKLYVLFRPLGPSRWPGDEPPSPFGSSGVPPVGRSEADDKDAVDVGSAPIRIEPRGIALHHPDGRWLSSRSARAIEQLVAVSTAPLVEIAVPPAWPAGGSTAVALGGAPTQPQWDPAGYKSGVWDALRRVKNYPRKAQVLGLEGKCIVKILVNHDGSLAATPVVVGDGTGHDILDEECVATVERVRFPPIPDSVEAPVTFRFPIEFRPEGRSPSD